MGTSDVIIGLALDQSGSMMQGASEVVQGFNAFREEQIAAPGSAYMTLVIFDGRAYTRFSAGKLSDIPELGDQGNEYSPGGSTPLYDGVALAIKEVDQFLVDNSKFDGKKIVVVFTDGYENASTVIQLKELNELISDRKAVGWEFVFLGSGGAAWTEGKNLAVDAASTVNMANNQQAYVAYAAMSSSVAHTRSTGQTVSSTLAQNAAAAGIPAQPSGFSESFALAEDEDAEMPHWGESMSKGANESAK